MSIDLQNLNEQLRELQPPSARDRLIFEAVVVKGRGQCEVAAEQGISQPRVSQIVAEVGEWLSRTLPGGRQHASPAGEMAVAAYVVEAQIDFLLQRTMHDIRESRKEKVTEKAGTRGAVQWTETKTEKRPIIKVGLLNAALRLSQAKAKLAGVDVTGRTQRKAAIAEERQRREAIARGQETSVRSQGSGKRDDEAKVKKPLIRKNEDSGAAGEIAQPQVEAAHEDKLRSEKEEFVKNIACKQLINHLREDPRCAAWTEQQFREHAQLVWDLEDKDPHPGPLPTGEEEESGPLLRGESEESGDFPKRDILPVSGGTTKRRRDERLSPQQRRRMFLAPLAVG
jgi:hypothetical protein